MQPMRQGTANSDGAAWQGAEYYGFRKEQIQPPFSSKEMDLASFVSVKLTKN